MLDAVRYLSWGGFHGYPRAAMGYLGCLIDAGVDVGWDVVVGDGRRRSWRLARSDRARRRAARLDEIDGVDRDGLRAALGRRVDAEVEILHIVPELWERFSAGLPTRVGNTVWETDRLPPHWARLLNAVDLVVVPTRFNRDVFAECGVTVPIHVVPHVASSLPEPVTGTEVAEFRRRHHVPEGHRVVYTVEAWTARKAPWRSIRAFVEAFAGEDGVTMVVKGPTRGQPSAVDAGPRPVAPQIEAIRSAVDDPPPVRLVDGDLPDRQIRVLHAVGDCYLSLTHGEGWGLSVFEAAASGNPVVTTGWGGVLDYLGDTWPFLVDHQLVPVVDAAGAVSFRPDQRWASAEVDHAVEVLRAVMADPAGAARACAPTASTLRERYRPEAVAPVLLGALEAAGR